MEAPKIHAFADGLPHRAADLNAMGIAVMQLVEVVNELTAKVDVLETELEALRAAGKAPARGAKTAQ